MIASDTAPLTAVSPVRPGVTDTPVVEYILNVEEFLSRHVSLVLIAIKKSSPAFPSVSFAGSIGRLLDGIVIVPVPDV
ncbi:MAG: hypothetical protein BWX89_00076 [candidate division TA06 bacterium ADurb.Bin131]|uniref:Uncharacterized protein n=1 Tax=candidate division TA06 bacterium ADurb.Bin131 TaxID=1852827 RepID=A0A1V6CEG4_UNCT6|nr:MAG: hypothetical protein BWX89_00076 [candidate division TA06 bacterium ADurb.Bin131]